jgi:biotin carboxylase
MVPAVLVTDGHLRASLAVVRSLGRAGYRVIVCSPRRRSLAGTSRHAHEHAQVPDALSAPASFEDAIVTLTREWSVDVLLPMSEEALLVLLPAARRMPGVRIPFPALEVFKRSADKAAVVALASTLGIDVPEQVVVATRDDTDAPALAAMQFPVVLKPARSVAEHDGERTKHGVLYAQDHTDLRRQVGALPHAAFPLLVQRRISGSGTGVFLLLWEGRLLGEFAHRRVREKPPSGGVSVCAESITADPATVERSLALLAVLGWNGLAMVEFKQDRVTGRHYLMEINGRFWGSLQLAVDAGVDFPKLLVDAAVGHHPAPVRRYRVGIRLRWWWGEVDHLLARLRRRADDPALGSRLDALKSFFLPGRDVRNEVLRRDDPWPFVRESLDWFRRR